MIMHTQNIGVSVIEYSYFSATTIYYSSRKRVSEENGIKLHM